MAAPYVETPQSVCRIGIACCDITPQVGIYHRMWGAARHDRSTGVHRPLTATAMYFQSKSGNSDATAGIVVFALDHCLLWSREMESLLDTVAARTGIERQRLIVNFSHTHAAGLMGFERVELPGGDLIPPYLDELADKMAALVLDAQLRLQPVVITYGVGRCSLAGHRDLWDDASKQWVCGFHPDGPADNTVLVARITGESGDMVATVVNYACHPTSLAWDNTLISPDYPGSTREVVEAQTEAPCVFLQGTSGDLGPREGFVGETSVADSNGRQLGYAALAAIESLPPPNTRFEYTGPVVSGATIGTWGHRELDQGCLNTKGAWRLRQWTVDLNYRPDLPTAEETRNERQRWQVLETEAQNQNDNEKASDCRAMVERMTRRLTRIEVLPDGKSFPFPVTLLHVGDAFWLTVEGEPYNALQRRLRERFPGVPIVVMSLANGSRVSYLPPEDVYGTGIYQETVAVLAPGSLEKLIAVIGDEIEAWLTQGHD